MASDRILERACLRIISRCHSGASIHITAATPARVTAVISRCVHGLSLISQPFPHAVYQPAGLRGQRGIQVGQPPRGGDGQPPERFLQLKIYQGDQDQGPEDERGPVQRLARGDAERLQCVCVGHSFIIPLIFVARPPPLPSAAARAIFTSAPGMRSGSICSPQPHPAHVSHSGADRGMIRDPSGSSKIAYRPRSDGSVMVQHPMAIWLASVAVTADHFRNQPAGSRTDTDSPLVAVPLATTVFATPDVGPIARVNAVPAVPTSRYTM